jgi:chemotaxis protein methyltransferase WspC
MNLAPVILWLQERIGLNPEALGPGIVAAAVEGRMQALGFADACAFLARLSEDPEEAEALIAQIVVPETWFFREERLFARLADEVQQLALTLPPGRSARILCVPCSTGEEPYSLSIALLEAGVSPERFTLHGVDLCARSLDVARRGRYGKFSFRQMRDDFRTRYFTPSGAEWELSERVCGTVRFRTENVVSSNFLANEEPFDVILCRNLFIYLHAEARERVLVNLDRLLRPRGLLFMGLAEPLAADERRFRRTGSVGVLLYRRVPAEERPGPPREPARSDPRVSDRAPIEEPVLAMPESAYTWHAEVTPSSAAARPMEDHSARDEQAVRTPEDALDKARRDADAGHLGDALTGCRALLARTGPSADIYTLMGIVYQARQEKDEAEGCFQKALYLRPDDREALVHSMILSAERGDHDRAALLRRRLERLASGGGT